MVNPRLFANKAVNQIKGMYSDVGKTVRPDVPLTYSMRNAQARASYDKMAASGQARDFKGFDKGSIDRRRVAALGATAYVGGDLAYRTASGGSAYRNNSGEKDFVGVPLI